MYKNEDLDLKDRINIEDDSLNNFTNLDNDVPQIVETTTITHDTELYGDIVSKSHLRIEGNIKGNVETDGNVSILAGNVIGNIKADNVGSSQGRVKGDIDSNNTIEILEDSIVEGDLNSQTVYIKGRVIGNITCRHTCIICSTGIVEGNINTQLLTIEENAIVNGEISMHGMI